jgi:drug/metabolite transporter (DMT)-like permease
MIVSKKYILLMLIGLIWGSQFIFQKIALNSFTPELIGLGRAVVGFITLFVTCKLLKVKPKSHQSWWIYPLIGLLEASIPLVLIPWGQQFISSAIASILIGTIPFFVVAFTPLVTSNYKITKSNIYSILIGFIGLLSLFAPDILDNRMTFNFLGPMAVLIAAASFAMALLLLNKCSHEHPLIVSRNVIGSASVQIIIISLFTTRGVPAHITWEAAYSILYLGIMCTGLVYLLYMVLISDSGPVFASLTNYLVPTFGVFIGFLFGREHISLNTWCALFLILVAVAVNQERRKSRAVIT